MKGKMTIFFQIGLEQYHAVGIVGFNSPEWFIADLGAIFAGYVRPNALFVR